MKRRENGGAQASPATCSVANSYPTHFGMDADRALELCGITFESEAQRAWVPIALIIQISVWWITSPTAQSSRAEYEAMFSALET